MALTAAEKQKRYREKQKLKAAGMLPEAPTLPPLTLPATGLSDFVRSGDEDEGYPFAVGYIWEDLREINLDYLLDGSLPEWEIAKTERIIEHLTTALETLTGVMSEFRRHQIENEIERIRKEDLGDPAKQEEALARIIRLNEVRKHLNKKFRLALFEYSIPGE